MEREQVIHFKELAHAVVGLARLKSVGETGRLEIQSRCCGLEPEFSGQQAGCLCCSL